MVVKAILILRKRNFSDESMIIASSLIIKGFFKKIVIADTLAEWVDRAYSSYADQSSFVLISAAIFFSFQNKIVQYLYQSF